MKRLGWLEAAGFGLAGAIGALMISRYASRTLGQKLQIGDTATVPIAALRSTDANVVSAMAAHVFPPNAFAKVVVTSISSTAGGDAAGTAGADVLGFAFPVVFSPNQITSLTRNGVPVP